MIFHIVPITPSPMTPPVYECSTEDCNALTKTIEMHGVIWYSKGLRHEAIFCSYACLLASMPVKHLDRA